MDASSPEATNNAASEPGSTSHILHSVVKFLRVVRQRKIIVLSCLAVSSLLGILYYLTATRYYAASAQLMVLTLDEENPTSVGGVGNTGRQLMPTYQQLVRSTAVINGSLEYLQPEDRVDLTGVNPRDWINNIRSRLGVSTSRSTNIMQITYESRDPNAAVSVVNAVVRSYLEFMDKTHKGTANDISSLLTQEQTQLEAKLLEKQNELADARRRIGVLVRPGSATLHPVVQRAVRQHEELIKAQDKRRELQSMMASIEVAVKNGDDLQQHAMAVANAVGTKLLSAILGIDPEEARVQLSLERGLLEDRATLSSMSEHFGVRHPKVVEINNRIAETEQFLVSYQQRLRTRLAEIQDTQLGPLLMDMVKQQLTQAWRLENSLAASFEQARGEAIDFDGDLAELEHLEHEVERLRGLHDVLLDKLANLDLQQESDFVRTAVLSEPVASNVPVWPKIQTVMLMAMMAGTGVGLAIVYVVDTLDDRFRSPEELKMRLGVPVLAMIRRMETPADKGINALQVHVSPNAVESESFRTLRTTLAFDSRETTRLVVSSSEPGDGKTTTLSNLAVSYAQSGKKTLLIDADMRRPGLSTLLERGLDGLSKVLRDDLPVDESAVACIQATGIDNLDVLASGPRPTNPAELLGSQRFSELLAWAETVYDQILVDAPPVLAAADPAIVGKLVDGVLLVTQPHKNRRRVVMRALETFTGLKVPVLGVVVNRAASEKEHNYYVYSEEYSYGYGYGHEYGEQEESAGDAPEDSEMPQPWRLAVHDLEDEDELHEAA